MTRDSSVKESRNWLDDSLSVSVAEKCGILENRKNPNKGMIGIVGHFPIKNSELTIEIVRTGSVDFGFLNDQDHPELMVINLSANDQFEYLRDQARIMGDVGCDLIVIPESDLSPQQKIVLENAAKASHFLYMKEAETYHDLSKRSLEELNKIETKLRPNMYDASHYGVIRSNVKKDIQDRERRFLNREKKDGGYPLIKSTMPYDNIVGVIGGAGPTASAQYSFDLAIGGVPHIAYHNNSAPYKIEFAQQKGHSFLLHYKNAAQMLKDLGCHYIAMPCNTAHLFKNAIFNNRELESLRLVDIAESVVADLRVNASSTNVILLGTDATVGIEGKEGLYDDILMKNGYKVIKPNSDQQKEVMSAIFNAKAGKMSDARNQINKVAAELRKEHGANVEIALVCTDLPIAFKTNELSELGAISSIRTLANLTLQMAKHDHDIASATSSVISDISDSEEEKEKFNPSSLLKTYKLSYEEISAHKQIKVYFENNSDVTKKAQELKQDLDKFANYFKNHSGQKQEREDSATQDPITFRVHPNQQYITFIGNREEKFKLLKEFLGNNNISISQTASRSTSL